VFSFFSRSHMIGWSLTMYLSAFSQTSFIYVFMLTFPNSSLLFYFIIFAFTHMCIYYLGHLPCQLILFFFKPSRFPLSFLFFYLAHVWFILFIYFLCW
jgi:hypothetical protein